MPWFTSKFISILSRTRDHFHYCTDVSPLAHTYALMGSPRDKLIAEEQGQMWLTAHQLSMLVQPSGLLLHYGPTWQTELWVGHSFYSGQPLYMERELN